MFVGSLQADGRFASFKGVWTGTYVAVASSDGTFYGEGQIKVIPERLRRAVNKLDHAGFRLAHLKSELGREDIRLLAAESHLGDV